jgi:hypothetical protein
MTMTQSGEVLKKIQARPVANPLEVAYFSASPFLFGAGRVMHYSVVPAGGEKPQVVPTDPPPDYLREALQKTMSGNQNVVFDFRVQVRRAGETDLFIENATREWDETKFPPVTIGRITILAPQTWLDSPERRRECEERVYTPWHSLADHQPLGGINRLRKPVYVASAEHRRTTFEKTP